MNFLYNILFYAGYFLILIFFSIIAIIFATKKHAWIWYFIGAVVNLLSLIGNQSSLSDYNGDYYAREIMTPYWTIYFVLLAIVACIIYLRKIYSKKNSPQDIHLKETENSIEILKKESTEDK